MKRTYLLTIILLLIIAFSACNKGEYDRDNSVIAVKSSIPGGTNCIPLTEALRVRTSDGNFPPVGDVFVSNDASFIYITVLSNYGFQPGGSIDIGFYQNTLPTFRPNPEDLNYSFPAGTVIAIPLNEIDIEDDDDADPRTPNPLISLICYQPIKIVLHADALVSLDGVNIVAMDAFGGSSLMSDGVDTWYKYFQYSLCCTECQEETAWGGNGIGSGKSWWYYFDVNNGLTQSIYAGKNTIIGEVEYSGGQLKITLTDGWVLDIKDENEDGIPDDNTVKIQGYNNLTSNRPSAGSFTTYKGNDLVVSVPSYNFYAIHLDVIKCN